MRLDDFLSGMFNHDLPHLNCRANTLNTNCVVTRLSKGEVDLIRDSLEGLRDGRGMDTTLAFLNVFGGLKIEFVEGVFD